ncbi:MAG TPA: hypothetical protein VGC72_04985 [Candidatus Elarobacter sp.]|jgi:hypothetical protein
MLYAAQVATLMSLPSWHVSPVAISTPVLKSSDFVLVGTVVQLGTSNVGSLTGGNKNLDIVVHVTRIVSGPSASGLTVGSDVTVRTPNALRYKLQKSYVFAVRSWLYDDNVAVVELGHDDAVPPKHPAVARLTGVISDFDAPLRDAPRRYAYLTVAAATGGAAVRAWEGRTITVAVPADSLLTRGQSLTLQTNHPLDAIVSASESPISQILLIIENLKKGNHEKRVASITANADDSVAVVAAHLLQTETVADDRTATHAGHLQIATLQVDDVLKGDAPATIRVLYSQGDDIRWGGAPNLGSQRSGIYFVHSVASAGLTPQAGVGLICFRTEDLLPVADLALVRQALVGVRK